MIEIQNSGSSVFKFFKNSMQFTREDGSDCILYFDSQIKILKRKSSSVKQIMIFSCTGHG